MGGSIVTLSDLLAELRIGMLNDRSMRTSGSSDYLWTDITLVRYINEAHRRFAVRSLVLRDGSTPEVTQVTLKTGVGEYSLHPAILSVLSAKLPDSSIDLIRAGHSALGVARTDTDNWDPTPLLLAPGRPLAYTTDEQVQLDDGNSLSAASLRLFPVPDVTMNNVVLKLRVVRKPLDDLTMSSLSAIPEIPEDHHLNMLDWAAYLALRIADNDTGDSKRSSDYAASFESHVQDARKEVMRKMFAPKSWGFGRNGWTW